MTIPTQQPARISLAGITGIREMPGSSGQRFTTGRNARGRFASWDRITLRITPRGHWYRTDDPRHEFHNDTVCRGCQAYGHFDYILDRVTCPAQPTAQDVARALLG
jgi:hypothetical protein